MIKVLGGKSEKDRISFRTSQNNVTAIKDEYGEIHIESEKANDNFAKGILAIIAIFGGIGCIKQYVILPLIEKGTLEIYWYLILAFIVTVMMIYAIIITRKKEGKIFLKNHGAEHAVLSAYKKLKRLPTIEEAKQFSRINAHCGITVYSALITSQLIGFAIYVLAGYDISEILLFLVPLIFNTKVPFNLIGLFMQFFTTAKPDDENIKLAIMALEGLEIAEEKSQNISQCLDDLFEQEKGAN